MKWNPPVTVEQKSSGQDWFIKLLLNGRDYTLTSYREKQTAERAASRAKELLGQHTEEELKDLRLFSNVLATFICEGDEYDGDEPDWGSDEP